MVVVDNMRPSLGVYTPTEALTPHMDGLATGADLAFDVGACVSSTGSGDSSRGSSATVVFSHAYCQVAWCSPSRNSFMSGRRPNQTLAFGFRDSFREPGVGANWTSLPQFFKDRAKFDTVRSFGKVFHPNLPPNFDYPASWTHEPFFQEKVGCVNKTMSCALSRGTFVDADQLTTDAAVAALQEFANSSSDSSAAGGGERSRVKLDAAGRVVETTHNFFVGVGLQSPRLPWSFPADVLTRYPPASEIAVTKFPKPMEGDLEWFRPTEVDQYSDVSACAWRE